MIVTTIDQLKGKTIEYVEIWSDQVLIKFSDGSGARVHVAFGEMRLELARIVEGAASPAMQVYRSDFKRPHAGTAM